MLMTSTRFNRTPWPRVKTHPGNFSATIQREGFPRHQLAGQDSVRLADLADDAWTAASADGIIVRAHRVAGFEPGSCPSPATSSRSAPS